MEGCRGSGGAEPGELAAERVGFAGPGCADNSEAHGWEKDGVELEGAAEAAAEAAVEAAVEAAFSA